MPRLPRVGFPMVMKIQSRDIPHKSEVGGVRVNITTKGEAFTAYQALLDNARKHRPNAAIQGVLVGPMAKKGVEIIVGTHDGCNIRPDDHGRPRRHHHGIVPRRDLSAGAGECGGSIRDAGGVEGCAAAQRISRRGEGRRCGAVAIDLAGVGAGGAAACEEISEIELNPVLVHRRGRA